ncbi:GntR family transcriptional regulator [Vibrio sp.]|nr:GntR family transcriptional regulator [Vibrio sp.]
MPSPTLTDKVAKLIRDDILFGELQPSEKLVVAELKEKYNVGASPIREALVQLSWSKYVQLEPQKGCWVAPISQDELNDLYESLRFVSKILLKKAIETGDESWELDVLAAFHRLSRTRQNIDELDWSKYEEQHSLFHISLLEGANSSKLFEFFSDVISQIKRYRYLAMSRANDEYLFDIDEQEMIMKCALAKDADQAADILDKHLLKDMQIINTVLEIA